MPQIANTPPDSASRTRRRAPLRQRRPVPAPPTAATAPERRALVGRQKARARLHSTCVTRRGEEPTPAEAHYRSLVDLTPAVVYVRRADPPHDFVSLSPRLRDVLGHDPDDLLGTPSSVEALAHPADLAAVRWPASAQAGAAGRATREYRLRAIDGRWVWLRDDAVLVPGTCGAPATWLGVWVDVSGWKQAEASARRSAVAAEEADRSKARFLAIAAHELRTPLTTIHGHVQLLQRDAGPRLGAEEIEDLAMIASGLERLTALVSDLLDLTRIEAGHLRLRMGSVDIGAVVEAAAHSAVPRPAPAVRVLIDVPPDLPPATGDRERLTQVLANLISNACKFTERGTIEVSARRVGGTVEIAVADTGIGIGADALPHVFDEFRHATSATHRRFGGTGLGLALVRKIVHLHGGTVEATSTLGVGSTFRVRLPVVPGAGEADATNLSVAAALAGPGHDGPDLLP